MRIDRMLAIVVILLNRRKITAKEMAERFEVSLRTVYRDIDALNLAGIPIISNQGSGGGYELPDNYKLNKQYMSIADLRSILTALKGVNAVLEDRDMETLFEKVQSLLPGDERLEPESGSDMIIFDTQGWGPQDKTGLKIQRLYEAVKNRRLIEIDYVDAQGRTSRRQVEPITIVLKGFAWYLFGFCKKRNDQRLFKLTRIKQIEVQDQVFDRKKRAYRKMDTRWELQEKHIEVVLKFSNQVKHVVQDYHEDAQILAEDDRTLTIKTRLPDGEWLLGLIFSYGPLVEVLSPPGLIKRIQARLAAIANIYST